MPWIQGWDFILGIQNWEGQLQVVFEDLKLEEVPEREMFSVYLLGHRHSPDWGEDREPTQEGKEIQEENPAGVVSWEPSEG